MHAESVIEVNSLSKTYRLYRSHRDRVKEFFHPLRKKYHIKHHALKDLSLSIQKGEVMGVIGENGSGKSTLLKILASVVSPTSGSFICKGRITALLELGGGFNLELTGIENVYFLGAIQGYSKKEMAKRLKYILDFAEIGEYANQPVKNYSSGMYVRLAFSININIDPEILIVDEALAVGDIRFQQKCYRKIREIKESGKTIVICTHALSVVKDFCTRAIWIDHGKIIEEGDPQTVTDKYQAFMVRKDNTSTPQIKEVEGDANLHDLSEFSNYELIRHISWKDLTHRQSSGSGGAVIKYAALLDATTNEPLTSLKAGIIARLGVIIFPKTDIKIPGVHMVLNGQFSSEVFNINNYHLHQPIKFIPAKPNLVVFELTFPHIVNGNYSVSLAVTDIEDGAVVYLHWIHDAMMLMVDNHDVRYKLSAQMVVPDARMMMIS
jgi:ABC-type polysaccharide/polyol phosphate transport system ATPase subunit